MKATDSPAVRAALSHLRDAEFAGWVLDDEVDGPLLLIETRKNPQLRLEAAILDFVGYWMTRERLYRPKASRGWRQAVRNWMNNAVRFGSWYAVSEQERSSVRPFDRSTVPKSPEPPNRRTAEPPNAIVRDPVACGEIVKAELERMKKLVGDAT